MLNPNESQKANAESRENLGNGGEGDVRVTRRGGGGGGAVGGGGGGAAGHTHPPSKVVVVETR